ncbi:hypothetical protein BRPE64_DCDS04870 (plasmid) [Caballeronia insecticola]|uniref:Uncharacterized protein n=1 Tax=Caballeronia insecticola TaxID=758793 RepID=R4WRZ0_9BURK|nr:hypothetical protein BRPE64_DCDS04870 [Caballeronia insecticola]
MIVAIERHGASAVTSRALALQMLAHALSPIKNFSGIEP